MKGKKTMGWKVVYANLSAGDADRIPVICCCECVERIMGFPRLRPYYKIFYNLFHNEADYPFLLFGEVQLCMVLSLYMVSSVSSQDKSAVISFAQHFNFKDPQFCAQNIIWRYCKYHCISVPVA